MYVNKHDFIKKCGFNLLVRSRKRDCCDLAVVDKKNHTCRGGDSP